MMLLSIMAQSIEKATDFSTFSASKHYLWGVLQKL